MFVYTLSFSSDMIIWVNAVKVLEKIICDYFDGREI